MHTLTRGAFVTVLAAADALPAVPFIDYRSSVPGDADRYDRAVELARAYGLIKDVRDYDGFESVDLVNGLTLSSPLGHKSAGRRPIEVLGDVTIDSDPAPGIMLRISSAQAIKLAALAEKTGSDELRALLDDLVHGARRITSPEPAGSPLASPAPACDTNVVSLSRDGRGRTSAFHLVPPAYVSGRDPGDETDGAA